MSSTQHYLAALKDLSLPGEREPWLSQTREYSQQRFQELGFPTLRDEDWKYTSLRPIEKHAYAVAKPQGEGERPVDDLGSRLIQGLDAHRLVFVDGFLSTELSEFGDLPAGARVSGLAQALAEDGQRLEPYLGHVADPGFSGFAALNTAAMADGAVIELGAGVSLERPVYLLFLNTATQGEVFVQPRVLVVAGEGARCAVIEHYVSVGEAGGFTNAITEVAVARGARVEHTKLQQENRHTYHVALLQVRQAADSAFTSHSVSFGSRVARNDINVGLDDDGARCVLNGLFMADGRQHVDFHTLVDHYKPHGTSDEFYKGILDGHGRGVFNGRVYVHPGAQKTDATQTSNNLLLSRDAEVDTKPQLEIFADDVKCAHGATVGQLDETMLFYLRSRGIDAKVAQGMLTYGFAHDVVERMSLEPIQRHVEQMLVNRLPEAVIIQGD